MALLAKCISWILFIFVVVNMIAKRIAHLFFSCIFVCKFIDNCVFVIYYLHYTMHILHLHTCLI